MVWLENLSERGWNEWGRSVILANVSVISVHVIIIIIITFDNTRRCGSLALSVADLSVPIVELASRVGSTYKRTKLQLNVLNNNNVNLSL